jgi:hypothetical protein
MVAAGRTATCFVSYVRILVGNWSIGLIVAEHETTIPENLLDSGGTNAKKETAYFGILRGHRR